MIPSTTILRKAVPAALIVFGLAVAMPAVADHGNKSNSYQAHTLVSNGGVPADFTDAHLKNSWGVAFNPAGFVWVANNHDGTSTLYDGKGVPSPTVPMPPIPAPLVVTIPPASGLAADIGSPTGIVFNWTNDFEVSNANGTAKGIAKFIFASEDGMISGWAPNVDATHALKAVTADAVYKGIAIAGNGSDHFRLYAADFHNRRIDVYDWQFKPVTLPGAFVDSKIPSDFAPFNIMNIQGNLYVAYAKTQPNSDDELAGPGFGFVDVFDADGNLLKRLARRGSLNAPWGVALAPKGFGRFSNDVLIGNFGDGTISAFDPHSGDFHGQLRGTDGKVLKVDGLWGIAFGNGILNQQTDTLFFAAGPNEEEDGAYGRIDFAPTDKGGKGGEDDD